MSDSAVGIFCCVIVPLLVLAASVAYYRKRRRAANDRTRLCPTCGATNTAPADYCGACGRYLVPPTWPPPVAAPLPVASFQHRPIAPRRSALLDEQDHIYWLIAELQRPDVRPILTAFSISALTGYYQSRLAALASGTQTVLAPEVDDVIAETTFDSSRPEPAPAPAPIPDLRQPDAGPPAHDVAPQEPVLVLPHLAPDAIEHAPANSAPVNHPLLAAQPSAPSAPPREPFRVPQPWKEWDSAVILLYLGAFLIVVAGLIYSSYSWERLEGWQKVGLLFLTTIAFTGGGLALLPYARVRPAAETFIGIGAFLVPMNAIAISNVSRDDATGPTTVGELGALLVTALYGFFSYRPGGLVYRYATVASALVAVALLPGAFGAPIPWGAPLVVLATSIVVDAPRLLRGHLRRFAAPVVHLGLVVLPVATAAGVAARWASSVENWWIVAATLAAAAISVARLALRRADDRLAWLWTGLVLTAVAACLAALDRPLVDGTVACAIAATAWLLLAELGPSLARRPVNRAILHGEAAALLLAAPFLTDPDARPLLFTLAWCTATAGFSILARLRDEPRLATPAAILATIAYLSLGNLIDGTDLYSSTPHALLLAPAPLLLAAAAYVIHRRRDGIRGRRWSLPIWLVAGAEGVLVTAIALVELADDVDTSHKLAMAIVCAAFAIVGTIAARALREPSGLLAAAVWLEGAVTSAIFCLPISEERRLPLLLLAHLLLAGFAAGVRLGDDWDIGRVRRWSVLGYLALGGVALASMLAVTSVYVFDLGRPPTSTGHPDASWWWPYLAVYALIASLSIIVGRRAEPRAVWATSLCLAAGGLLALRMAYGTFDVDPWRWPAIVTVIAGSGAALAMVWRPRRDDDLRLRRHLIGLLAGCFALPALIVMAMRTAAFALDRDGSFELIGHLEARWWWLDLAVYVALSAGAWGLGRRRDEAACAPLVIAGLTLGNVLALRMLYGHIPVEGRHWWPLIAAVGLVTTLAVWFAARRREGQFPVALQTQSAAPAALVGLPAVAAMLIATAGYVVDLSAPYTLSLSARASWWWPFLGFFVSAAAIGCWIGPRLRRLDLSPAVTTTAVAALLLLLRMAYSVAPFDRPTWLPLLTIAGAVTAAGGLAIRRRWSDRFGRRVGTQMAAACAVLGLIGLVGSVAVTLDYVVDVSEPFTASHAEARLWWWRFLVLHLAAVVAAWVGGRRTARPEPGPVVVVFGTLSLLLGLRMATTDLMIWTYAGMIVTIAVAALLVLDDPRRDSPFLKSLRTSLEAGAAAIGLVSLTANLVLGASGEGSDAVQTLVYALLCVTIFIFSLWRRQPLLAYCAVTSALVAISFAVAAFDADSANAGYAFAALSWLLAAGTFAIPVAGRWTGQRIVWERSALAVALLPILLGMVPEGALDPGEPAYQRLVLAILSAAGVVALTAVGRRSAVQGYAASVLGLLGLLMQITVAEPANVQAYTAPVAAYLLGLAWFMRRVPVRCDALVGAGAALLMFPSFAQSFGPDGYGWALLCGAEGLAFVFAGLVLGRRVPIAAGVVGLTAIVLRQSVDYVHSLPTWAILAVVGVLLLGTGTLWLAAAESLTRRFEEMRARWGGLR